MRESLADSRSGIIAEFKRKSPSKGWIKEEGRADVIPAAYAAAGAAALSILTDGKYFGGCLDYIRQARPMTDTPILRKEFIIDEYQLYQACQAGADAVLLIAAALTRPDYERLTRKAHELGLEVLLEIHTEKGLDYLAERPDMLGVNNRHLGTFHTDVENSFRIALSLAGRPPLGVGKRNFRTGHSPPVAGCRFSRFPDGRNLHAATCPRGGLENIHSKRRTMKPLLIKVCGMRDADNIRQVEALTPDMMGFICWEAPAAT